MNKKEKTKSLKAIDSSIAHWKRMINWAKKQNKNNVARKSTMKIELGEVWMGKDCALCNKAAISLEDEFCPDCSKCEIVKCGYKSCEHRSAIWGKVDLAETWGTWITNANKMMEMLKKVRNTIMVKW